ncbi:hypothetical protein Tco_0154275 [Tanacetum coccineum]
MVVCDDSKTWGTRIKSSKFEEGGTPFVSTTSKSTLKEQEKPIEQSRLRIFLCKEILEGGMIRIHSAFVHDKVCNRFLTSFDTKTAPKAKIALHRTISSNGSFQSGAIWIEPSVRFSFEEALCPLLPRFYLPPRGGIEVHHIETPLLGGGLLSILTFGSNTVLLLGKSSVFEVEKLVGIFVFGPITIWWATQLGKQQHSDHNRFYGRGARNWRCLYVESRALTISFQFCNIGRYTGQSEGFCPKKLPPAEEQFKEFVLILKSIVKCIKLVESENPWWVEKLIDEFSNEIHTMSELFEGGSFLHAIFEAAPLEWERKKHQLIDVVGTIRISQVVEGDFIEVTGCGIVGPLCHVRKTA